MFPDTPNIPLPELDQFVSIFPDLGFLEVLGPTTADRVEAAVRSYLWAEKISNETGFYPSLNDLRKALLAAGYIELRDNSRDGR